MTNNGGSRPVIADAGRWFGTSPSPLANRALVAFNFTTPPSYGVRGNSPAGAAGPSKRKYHIAGNEDGPSFSDPNDPDNNNVGVVCVIDTQHDDPNQLRGCRGFVDPRDQCSLTADNGGPQSGPGWICKADPTVTGVPDPGEPNQGLRCRDTDINLSTFTCTDFHYYGDGSEQACNVLTQQTGTDPDGSKWTCFPTTKEGGEGMVCRATSSNGPCIPTGGQCSLLYQDHEVLAKWNGQLIMCQPKPGQGDPNPPGGWSFCQNVPPDQQAALDCFGNLPPATNQPTLR